MPFDDTSHDDHGGDGSGRKHHNMDEFVNNLIGSVYASCVLSAKCVPCTMWNLGAHLLSKWVALRCKRHIDANGYQGHEAIGEMVAAEIVKIMDVIARDAVKFTVQECAKEILAYKKEGEHDRH